MLTTGVDRLAREGGPFLARYRMEVRMSEICRVMRNCTEHAAISLEHLPTCLFYGWTGGQTIARFAVGLV